MVKPAPGRQAAWLTPALLSSSPRAEVASASGVSGAQFEHPRGGPLTWVRCPYGAAGDDLWVRESAYIAPPDFGDADLCNRIDDEGRPCAVDYAASMDADAVRCADDYGVKLTPSIHMPRWASRITLRVTSVRVERLHAITAEDILDEGVRVPVAHDGGAVLVRCTGSDPPATFLDMRKPRTPEDYLRAEWASLWCEVYGRASYDANPWVWRVGFERVQP